jgi:hypothetical protein
MNRRKWIFPFILFFFVGLVVTGANADEGRNRVKIEWPGGDFRELQSAIDAAPDGAIIQIKEGVYEFNEPLYVRGKRLTLTGAGSGLEMKNRARLTQLVGPRPNPVVDERGDIVLLAEAVEGLFNLVDADVVIQDMQLTGFDAGIVAKADERGNSGPTVVNNVLITDTGRGILSLSSSDLTVKESTIMNTRWNGISAGPSSFDPKLLPKIHIEQFTLVDPEGAGIYIQYAVNAGIYKAFVYGAKHGGIVAVKSNYSIHNSTLISNVVAGILIQGEHPAIKGSTLLEGNSILYTQPLGDQFGDGVVAMLYPGQQHLAVVLTDNYITSNKRAGVSSFGADLTLSGNKLLCNLFDMDGELFDDQPSLHYVFHDNGQNSCGCPGAGGPCKAQSSLQEPPPPPYGL